MTIFLRALTKAEKKSNQKKRDGWYAIPERDGFVVVYMPYGSNGAGFYYEEKL